MTPSKKGSQSLELEILKALVYDLLHFVKELMNKVNDLKCQSKSINEGCSKKFDMLKSIILEERVTFKEKSDFLQDCEGLLDSQKEELSSSVDKCKKLEFENVIQKRQLEELFQSEVQFRQRFDELMTISEAMNERIVQQGTEIDTLKLKLHEVEEDVTLLHVEKEDREIEFSRLRDRYYSLVREIERLKKTNAHNGSSAANAESPVRGGSSYTASLPRPSSRVGLHSMENKNQPSSSGQKNINDGNGSMDNRVVFPSGRAPPLRDEMTCPCSYKGSDVESLMRHARFCDWKRTRGD